MRPAAKRCILAQALTTLLQEVVMRVNVALIAFLALTPLLASSAGNKQAKGLDQLRGSWEVVKKSDVEFQAKRFIFDGDKLTVIHSETEKNETKVKLDSTAKPMRIDIIAGNQTSL